MVLQNQTEYKNPKEWEPNHHTRICSAHFINNSKSKISRHPSHVPSIFPGKENTRNSIQRLQRFERSRTRQLNKKINVTESILIDSINSHNSIKDKNINNSSDIEMEQNAGGMITEAQDDCHKDVNVMNVCPPAYRSITCQTEDFIPDIPTDNYKMCEASMPSMKRNVQDSSCDPINFESIQSHCKGFHGFSSITKLLFNIHRTTVNRIFVKNLQQLNILMKNFIFWPSKAAVQATLPESFKLQYPDTRVIIDCTKVNTEVPPAVEHRVSMYSDYKHHHTMKFLVGCTPSGFISFLSKCYGGRAGNCFITNDCGLVDLIEPGEVVLADKGFPQIQTKVEEKNAIFAMPPFCNKNQFTPEEVDDNYNIASVRIHIERVNQRIKDFSILSKVPVSLLPHVDEIVFVICAIINIQKPLFNQEKSVTE
ncbi:uncharacterized protein LOC124413861 [Diprion similis]|uniref:uncharacterized protein LOC124413861 n=1 Tax=Diprion similis TaxID=362088 RepID=UPI001EF86DA4|nr:uncharacterized protein LOC124413861 [Diprion similis]